jgi:cobyrinic acid a,c-diamide synthase
MSSQSSATIAFHDKFTSDVFNEQECRPEIMSQRHEDLKAEAAEEEIQMYYLGALTREELDEKYYSPNDYS